MFITNEMIWKELQATKKLIKEIASQANAYSIEEVSLNKAAKLMRRGKEFLVREVEEGRLKARVYKDSKKNIRYRFRLADIRQYQERDLISKPRKEKPVAIETPEEIGKRIFG